MFNKRNINGLEMAAQFEEDRTTNVKITTQKSINWLRVEYKGNAEFKYFLDGKGGKATEIGRDQAEGLLRKEV